MFVLVLSLDKGEVSTYTSRNLERQLLAFSENNDQRKGKAEIEKQRTK
jgi:hypothetical protein